MPCKTLSLLCPALLLAALALAACMPAPAPEPGPDLTSCKAASLQSLRGQPASQIDRLGLTNPVRKLPPNSIMTMDYRAERLNVEIDDKGRITKLFCG